ncbi:MAG: helix-turn-helix domain-containing protein [Chitinophagales bacterium]
MRNGSLDCKLDTMLVEKENNMDIGQIMTNRQVAEMLGISLRTLQKYRDKGMIAFSQVVRKICYQHSDVEAFIQKLKIKSDV